MANHAFFKHILNGRWFSMSFYFLFLAGSGGTYLFSLYSREIKEKFSYDQEEINFFTIFKDTGASFGLLSEFILGIIPWWLAVILANLANFICYLLLWFSLEGRLAPKNTTTWVFRGIFFFLGWSKSIHKATCSSSSTSRFEKVNKGLQALTLTSFVKTGASLMTLFVAIFCEGSSTFILLFLAAAPSFLCLTSSLYFTKNFEIHSLDKKTENFLYSSFLFHAICVGFMLVIGSVALQRGALTAGIAIVLLLSPFLTSFGSEIVAWKQLREKGSAKATASEEVKKKSQKSEKNNLVKFFMVAFATNVAVASTLTTIDQLGQISEALALNQLTLRNLLQVLLVFSLVGRLFTRCLFGLTRSFNVSPGVLGVFWGCLLCLTHLSIAFPFNTGKSLYVSCVLIGLCHGGQLQLASMALHGLFKKKSNFFYQLMKLMIPAFTFIFKALVVSPIYIKEANNQLVCLGKQCFQESFLIMSSSVFGASVVMWAIVIKMDFWSLNIEEIQNRSSSVHDKASTNKA